jgi:hypothetical protein
VNNIEKTYRTDHLYLAAYLVCRGQPVLTTQNNNSRIQFIFAETSQLTSDAASFMPGGTVEARQFSFEILKLKRRLPRTRAPRESVERVKQHEDRTVYRPAVDTRR